MYLIKRAVAWLNTLLGQSRYNLMQDDDRRGDGYMNAYQPVLTQLPWMCAPACMYASCIIDPY